MKIKSRELASAISIAASAHLKQATKDGMPYILHPLHVMSLVTSPFLKAIAVLHDVIEDTELEAVHLTAAGIPTGVVESVEILTRVKDQSYDDYITSIIESGDTSAMFVKLADLTHNMDLERLPEITPKDVARKEKYQAAFKRISQAIASLGT